MVESGESYLTTHLPNLARVAIKENCYRTPVNVFSHYQKPKVSSYDRRTCDSLNDLWLVTIGFIISRLIR